MYYYPRFLNDCNILSFYFLVLLAHNIVYSLKVILNLCKLERQL